MRKILLIKRGALGDLLMATPLIRQLKQRGAAVVDLVVGAAASVATAGNPYLRTQIVLPDRAFTLAGFSEFLRCLLKLRSEYDYVFVLDKHCYFNWMARLLAAPVIGYRRGSLLLSGYRRGSLLLSGCSHSVHYHDVERYHGEYYLDLLAASGLVQPDYTDVKLDLTLSSTARTQVQQLLAAHGLARYVVVVNSGGNNSYETSGIRMLPDEQLFELLGLLLERKLAIVLLGGQVDANNYQRYCEHFGNPALLLNWAGKLSLSESCVLIQHAEHFYTTDCGAMHLGVLTTTPLQMTAFFGPTNPAHILPADFLAQSALWSDQAIYDPSYQLAGVLPSTPVKYFQQINLGKLLK